MRFVLLVYIYMHFDSRVCIFTGLFSIEVDSLTMQLKRRPINYATETQIH